MRIIDWSSDVFSSDLCSIIGVGKTRRRRRPMADLFTYPNAPGAQNRDTSRAAADHVAERAPVLRARVLAVIERSNGLTADEAAGRLGVSILSVRPRVTELARLPKVRDSGPRRPKERNSGGLGKE